MDYTVTLNGKQVGKVQLNREGLYYRLTCRCALDGGEMYRLEAACGGAHLDLGILVPVDHGFGMAIRLPVKKLGEGEPVFRLRSAAERAEGQRFVPIKSEEPFAYIAQLRHAALVRRGGETGILLPKEEKTG